LFAKAKNFSEIARDLGITLPTLRNHLHSINEKQRTHNRLEAVMHAMQRGLIYPPSVPPANITDVPGSVTNGSL
jgi:DNA-binding NarL/FixJ family response regulator